MRRPRAQGTGGAERGAGLDQPGTFTKGPGDTRNLLQQDMRETDALIPSPVLDPARNRWTEFKNRLSEDYGFNIGFFYTALVQGLDRTPTGSLTGSGATAAAGGSFSVLGTWELYARGTDHAGTLAFHLRDAHRYTSVPPAGFAGEFGARWPTTVFYDDFGFHPVDLNWTQSIVKDRLMFRLGMQESFDAHDFSSFKLPIDGFMNGAFGLNPSVAWAEPALGSSFLARPRDDFYLLGGFYDANARPDSFGIKTFFDDREYLKVLDIGYDPGTIDPARRVSVGPLTVLDTHVTLWHVDRRDRANVPEGIGATFYAEGEIGQLPPFIRVGFSDGDGSSRSTPAALKNLFAVGAAVRAPFGSEDDLIGLAYGTGEVDREAGDSFFAHTRQHSAEIFYRVELVEGIAVTPDVQLFWNPVQNVSEDFVTVFGLRVKADR